VEVLLPIAEAHVPIDRPSRYLIQICNHANHMGRVRPWVPTGDSGGHTSPEVRHVSYSEASGTIRFAEGQCTLQATAGTLTIRVEAADEDTLRRLQDGIATRLERIGRRDQLAVTWKRSQASTASSGDPSGDPSGEQPPSAPPSPPTGAGKSRRRGRLATIALVIGGALVAVVHLGQGGGVVASAWTGWATNIVLALTFLKLLSIAGHVVLGGFVVLRGGRLVHDRWMLRHPPPEAMTPPRTDQGEDRS
jgi:hypothetical protein